MDVPTTCTLTIGGESYELPIVVGTEGERAIDIGRLRATTGYVTLDDGYANTASCQSQITYIDGDQGILRYRGIGIEELASRSSFVETSYLVLFGQLPTTTQRAHFTDLLTEYSSLHTSVLKHFDAFPPNAHPMAIMSAMIQAVSTHDRPKVTDDESYMAAAARLMSITRTIAAASYKSSIGETIMPPRYDLHYVENFLHMMFSVPYRAHEPLPEASRALNQFLILHADHEQNCSTSTVRMVASGEANMYASVAAGVSALWGKKHGGANMQVVQMLQQLRDSDQSIESYIAKVKDKTAHIRLMGFGHRVYRNFDPRARVLKAACEDLLNALEVDDPLLDVARRLEEAALHDDYFIERKLYPNVDFYSGIVLRALGIPLNMFTVMFAIGRTPGWIAHWREVNQDPSGRIHRPRQIYQGETEREFVARKNRQ